MTAPTVTQTVLEQLRSEDESGEFWSARAMQPVSGYSSWRDFANAIERAKLACANSGQSVENNFADARKVSGERGPSQQDYRLSRYGAYLVAMNGDPRKPEIAAAQTYFAVRTREAELRAEPRALTTLELIDIARTAEMGRLAEIERREIAEAESAELRPSAAAWTALADAAGDYSLREAAEILCRANIKTGQNILARQLKQIGWTDRRGRPYQSQINNGRLAVRTRTFDDPYSGEPHITTQIRITGKGVDALYRAFTGTSLALVGAP